MKNGIILEERKSVSLKSLWEYGYTDDKLALTV